jgi:hypothetical protein
MFTLKAAGIEAVQTQTVEWTAIDEAAEKDGKAIRRNRALNPGKPMARFHCKTFRGVVRGKIGAESRKGLSRD